MLKHWVRDVLHEVWNALVFLFLLSYMIVLVGMPLVNYLRG